MSQSHDNYESVIRLLDEKERDLELSATIGKELLEQNQELQVKVADLELEVKLANESLAQIQHELHKKNKLVAILTNDLDEQHGKFKNIFFSLIIHFFL